MTEHLGGLTALAEDQVQTPALMWDSSSRGRSDTLFWVSLDTWTQVYIATHLQIYNPELNVDLHRHEWREELFVVAVELKDMALLIHCNWLSELLFFAIVRVQPEARQKAGLCGAQTLFCHSRHFQSVAEVKYFNMGEGSQRKDGPWTSSVLW